MIGRMPKLPASLVTAMLMSQAASLRVLSLDMSAAPLSSTDIAVLAALTGLEDLYICLPTYSVLTLWEDHGTEMIDGLSHLPTLKKFQFDVYDDADDAAQPTVGELAAFSSAAMTRMEWELASDP